MLILYTLKIEPFRAQLLLMALAASFIGLMIFLILIMDHPNIGDFWVEPEAFSMLKTDWIAHTREVLLSTN